MKNTIKIAVLSIIICSSCEGMFWNYDGFIKSSDTEFGNCILLDKSDTTAFHSWPSGSKTAQKGVFIKYHRKEKVDTLFIWNGATVIDSHVLKVRWDSLFILVDQKPLDSIFGKYDTRMKSDSSMYGRPFNPHNARDMENKLRKSNVHCYWIIVKRSNDVFGPLSKEEYLRKRVSLSIPKELELKIE